MKEAKNISGLRNNVIDDEKVDCATRVPTSGVIINKPIKVKSSVADRI